MEHKEFVESEISRTIASLDRLAKSLVSASNADEEKETALMAHCFTTKQDLKKLQTELIRNPKLDAQRFIDEKLERSFVGIVRILDIETAYIRRCYSGHVKKD